MHKANMVQKIRLALIEERLRAIAEASYNTFLKTEDIFLDMLAPFEESLKSNQPC